ncbi:MAG: OprD family outer membrane porin [Chitinophagaceae bacterium]
MKRILIALVGILNVAGLDAQHQDLSEKSALWQGEKRQLEDSTSLLYAFRKGQMHGHFRYFFMATDNSSGLTDYYANAVGGGVKYETAPFYGFQFGVSGFFVYNIGSSDLVKPDPATSQANRYEVGLFDLTDPDNKSDIDRLEELYLKYRHKGTQIIFGKQQINTPFINLQDGRMRPTNIGGLYAEIHEWKKTKLDAGIFYQISPRSTVAWYKIGESIGLYPQGVNTEGTRSDYAGNIESKGVALLNLSHDINKNIKIRLSDLFVENVFNSLLLQVDFSFPVSERSKWITAVQMIRQDAVADGGNTDPAKAYFSRNGHSQTFGALVGWQGSRWSGSMNYNRINSAGRYLMPREWGRDPFFTFLPRERNEGLGDVHAFVLKTGYKIPKIRLKAEAAIGYYDLPSVTNYRLNKYGMPSYGQLNLDLRYEFSGFLKGFDTQLLFVHKTKTGNSFGNDRYVINKVDMSVWNLVVNYHF